eukprot:gene16175-biopygen23248
MGWALAGSLEKLLDMKTPGLNPTGPCQVGLWEFVGGAHHQWSLGLPLGRNRLNKLQFYRRSEKRGFWFHHCGYRETRPVKNHACPGLSVGFMCIFLGHPDSAALIPQSSFLPNGWTDCGGRGASSPPPSLARGVVSGRGGWHKARRRASRDDRGEQRSPPAALHDGATPAVGRRPGGLRTSAGGLVVCARRQEAWWSAHVGRRP